MTSSDPGAPSAATVLTLRRTLLSLFVALGLALCLAVAAQLAEAVRDWREADRLGLSNAAREALARATLALGEERELAYAEAAGARIAPGAPAGEDRAARRARSDEQLAAAAAAVEALDHSRALVDLQALARQLDGVRRAQDGVATTSNLTAREGVAAYVLSGYTGFADDMQSLRLLLLSQEMPVDRPTAAAFELRRHVMLLIENLMLDRTILGRLLAGPPSPESAALLERAGRNRERASLALDLIEGPARLAGPMVHEPVRALAEAMRGEERAERAVVAALAGSGGPPEPKARWLARSDETLRTARELLEGLFDLSRQRIEALRAQSLHRTILWAALLLAGVAAMAAGTLTVVQRVLRPLESLRASMLGLARGDLSTPLPLILHRDEIGTMADAVRAFKANAVLRHRLQDERLALHERLKDAYGQLRLDLESAAAVQAALLPQPARLGGVRFLGRLGPSHVISGDSYDVLRQPNGPVHFFLIDVAGHGAAAALVSVAAHYSLTQAILARLPGQSLSGLVAGINREWPEQLPYFTVVVGELCPERGEGVLVQAGHPPPLLLRRADGVERLGDGGLPVGVIRDAAFDEVRFDFGPGDRLLLYSDGVTEAEAPGGEAWGEERLLERVRALAPAAGGAAILDELIADLQDWRGGDGPDDDMTLVMLEASDAEHDGGDAGARAGAAAG